MAAAAVPSEAGSSGSAAASSSAGGGKPTTAYRLVVAEEWAGIQATGEYPGAALDLRDGYLHMSTADTVVESARRYFGDKADVMVLVIGMLRCVQWSPHPTEPRPHTLIHPPSPTADLTVLGEAVRWDPVASRGGVEFPHLYGMRLPRAAVTEALSLPRTADGTDFVFPPFLLAAAAAAGAADAK